MDTPQNSTTPSKEELLESLRIAPDSTPREIKDRISKIRAELADAALQRGLSFSVACQHGLQDFYREETLGVTRSRRIDWKALEKALGL